MHHSRIARWLQKYKRFAQLNPYVSVKVQIRKQASLQVQESVTLRSPKAVLRSCASCPFLRRVEASKDVGAA